MRLFAISAALLGVLSVLGPASPATAEQPEIRRHGAACPPTGCSGARRSSAASSLGFAAVVLATGLIARRGAADSR
jgi:hypothetical protein